MFVAESLFALELIALAIGFLLVLISSTNLLSGLRNAGYVIGGVIVFGALALMIVSAVYTNKYGRLTVPINQYIQQLTGEEQSTAEQQEKSDTSAQEVQALRQQVQQQSQQIQQNSNEIQQNRQTIRNLEEEQQEQIENIRRNNASNSARRSSTNAAPETGINSQTSSILTLVEKQKACSAKKCGIPKKGR